MKMDLNGPGASLFQGNDLNNYDNLEQREEEQEALEEQKRRDLELRNMLENAFDDVSFDNDDGSLCNGSENQSISGHSTFHNSFHPELDLNTLKETAQTRGVTDFDNNHSSNHIENYNTPLKHPKKNQVKRVDFSNDHENFTDQCRKQVQNGSLHDIVDASGGGDVDHQTSMHYKHCFQKSPLGEAICNGVSNNSNGLKPNYTDNAEDSSEQLKILYDVRVREVHRLTELIDSMRNEHEIELNSLKHQLALMAAEKERANMSQTQLQSLLVECKQQVEQLVNDVDCLEKANKELEACKRELLMEFDTAKLTIDDLQRKIIVLEKGSRSKSEAVQYELNLKSLTEKHNMELMNVKKELENYVRNCETLAKENEELKLKISRLTQINDENLAKKSEIINRLSQQIDETQKQCESLMKSSTIEDNFRLQTELKILKEEKSQLVLKLENLEKENSRQEDELKQYESLSRISLLNDSREFEGSEVNGKLGAELYRALSGQKAKRLEIKNLQTQLNEKNEQILAMVESEKMLKMEITRLKDEINKYISTVRSHEELISRKEEENVKLQKRIEEFKNDESENLKSKCRQLEKEIEILKSQITVLEKEKLETMNNYSEEYMRFHNEGLERVREETEKHFKLEMLKKDLENENLKKEVEEIKNMYVEVYNSKENLLSQLEKERNSGRSSGVDLEEVKRLQKELEKSRHRILELDQTLKQQYQQEVEILNLDINQLNLQIEKIKKEKDREVAEKDKILVENELLKTEIEQVTSEKNLLYLDYEKLQKDVQDLHKDIQNLRESSEYELKELIEKHSLELQSLSNKYEVTIKTLKKEIDLTLGKSVRCESKYTSPMKNTPEKYGGMRNVATQNSLVSVDKSTSPLSNPAQHEITSPTSSGAVKRLSGSKTSSKESRLLKDISVLTDPEPVKIPKKEVVAIMEKLGAHHEEEMKALENRYRVELKKLDKRFQVEVDKAKDIIRRELKKEYALELERMEEKHRIELENRIEQEKKEAVVDLITEWACEVQSLKTSYAESQTEMEKMKMKYKAAKNVALQYKSYFKSKAEHMKEEWKKIEDGYEKALRELEKNVHILVDVKEDEVKAKVESITKIYEQKINKMKQKLSKCEDKLRAETESERKKGEELRSQEKLTFRKELERLSVPDGNLNHKPGSSTRKKGRDLLGQFERLREAESQREDDALESSEGASTLGEQRKRQSLDRMTSNESERERIAR